MDVNFFISEILSVVIGAGAILIFWQLKISKDGMLRKILMGYFLIEAYIYLLSGAYWWLSHRGHNIIPIESLRIMLLMPKAVIKAVFLWWIIKTNRQSKT